MHLTEVLQQKGINPPGISQEGSAWLAKTLHPADNAPPWAGIPTGSGLPSVVMEYESLVRITPNAGAVGTYQASVNLIPHPLQPMSGTSVDSVGGLTWGMRNPTLWNAGDTFRTMTNNFMAIAGAYRMTHCAATVELDAPALSNQGSVVAAQYPMVYHEFNPSYTLAAGADAGKLFVSAHVRATDTAVNQLNQEALAAKPFSYSGLAKDGVYMVLKMDPDVEWGRTRDCCFHTSASWPSPDPTGVALPTAAGALGTNESFPWYGGNLAAADRFIFAYVNPATATGSITGSLVPKIMQPNFGRMTFWNLSVNSGLTIRVRWGVELLVHPTSALAPSTRVCAPRDDIALTAYSRIVDQLPDAFPGSYNSWDDLTKVLRQVWKQVSPYVGGAAKMVPGVGGLAATGIQAVGNLLAAETKAERRALQEPLPVINIPAPEFVAQRRQKPRQRKNTKVVYEPVVLANGKQSRAKVQRRRG